MPSLPQIQNDSYISIYDHTQQNWSLRFASSAEAVAFAQHVLLAKHLMAANPDAAPLLTLDAKVPDKGKVRYALSLSLSLSLPAL